MRDIQIQTPKRDKTPSTRRSKSNPYLDNYLSKVSRKSLIPAFKTVAVEDSPVFESTEEISEVIDEESFDALVNPWEDTQSETVAGLHPVSPQSSAVTYDKHVVNNSLDEKSEHQEVDSLKIEFAYAIKHLREARIQVMKSNELGHSKKLLDALINVIIEEFYGGLYDEMDWLDKLLSRKFNLIFLIFTFGIFAMFWLIMGAKSLHTELPPT